jgi:hypothetical protein
LLALLGGVAVVVPILKPYALVLVTAGFILLMLGNLFKKL